MILTVMKKTAEISVKIVLLVFLMLGSCLSPKEINEHTQAVILKVEGREGFVVTDEPFPTLSWTPVGEINGRPVAGYEVNIAHDSAAAVSGEGTIWKSEFLPLSNGPQVFFDASELPPGTEAWWRVRIRYEDGQYGDWGEISCFETGLKSRGDWQGEWIGMDPETRKRSAPQFRKEFELKKPVRKARIYVSSCGWHESWLNGVRLGDEVLQPAQTDYEERIFYVAHDVTSSVKKGVNVLGFWIGDGFYNQDIVWGNASYGSPGLIAQLEITHEDGSVEIISTDTTWNCKASPVVESNVYAGETYDARLADPDWAEINAQLAGWEKVISADAPG